MQWSSKQVVLPILIGTSLGGLCFGALYLFYKDSEQYDSSQRKKRTTVEMRVPKKFVPAIIGRGGGTIKDIERRTSTKIHFGNDEIESQERVCYIQGVLVETTLAEAMIQKIIDDQPVIETYEMLLPQKFCSTLLCNNKLEVFRSSANAKIILEKTRSYNADAKRRIIIKGTAEQIADAMCEIEDKLQQFNNMEEQIKIGQSSRSPRGQALPKNNVVVNVSEDQVALGDSSSVQEGTKEVYVSASESPSRFWVQVVGPSALELDALVKAMTDYYSNNENRELHALNSIAPGEIVAARFDVDKSWYRGEITSDGNEQYEVYFVDYGDSALINAGDILELRTDFLSLRFQAIEFSLANVKPKGTEWSTGACQRFGELVHCAEWKVLVAKVHGFNERSLAQGRSRREGSPIPRVDLFDKIDDQDLNIGKQLVIENLAEFMEVSSSTASSTLSLSRCKHNNSANPTPLGSPVLARSPAALRPAKEPSKPIEEICLVTPEELDNGIQHAVRNGTEQFMKAEMSSNNYTNGKVNKEISNRVYRNGRSGRGILPAGYEDEGSGDDDTLEMF